VPKSPYLNVCQVSSKATQNLWVALHAHTDKDGHVHTKTDTYSQTNNIISNTTELSGVIILKADLNHNCRICARFRAHAHTHDTYIQTKLNQISPAATRVIISRPNLTHNPTHLSDPGVDQTSVCSSRRVCHCPGTWNTLPGSTEMWPPSRQTIPVLHSIQHDIMIIIPGRYNVISMH